MAGEGDDDGGQTAIDGARGEGGDAGRFDGAVEALVEGLEALEVRAVAGLVHVEQRHHQAGAGVGAADAARGLDVLGGGLGLPEHHHQPQALDVEADGDHVGGERDVDRRVLLLVRREVDWARPAALCVRDVVGRACRLVSSTHVVRDAAAVQAKRSRRLSTDRGGGGT